MYIGGAGIFSKVGFFHYLRLGNVTIVSFAKNADVLLCESRFMEEDISQAQEHMHLTTKDTGILAADAKVDKLIVSHFSRRYTDEQAIINKTREYFKETY